MKRITSEEEKEKKANKNKWIVGFVLIFLLLFSTLGYSLLNGGGIGNSIDGEISQEGKPYFDGIYWNYQKDGQSFKFSKSLDEINGESIEIDKTLNDYIGMNLYIDSDNVQVLNELAINLGKFSSRVQEACYGNCEKDFPEKNCSENLIIFRENEENNIVSEDKCIFIYGDMATVDYFLYKIIGFY